MSTWTFINISVAIAAHWRLLAKRLQNQATLQMRMLTMIKHEVAITDAKGYAAAGIAPNSS